MGIKRRAEGGFGLPYIWKSDIFYLTFSKKRLLSLFQLS